MILDTSFIIEMLDGDPEALSKAEEMHSEGNRGHITPVVLYELYYGAIRSGNPDEVRMVANIAKMYLLTEMGHEEGERGARILAKADNASGGDCGVGHRDAMIAGVADLRGDRVLAADGDFDELGVDTVEISD